jgi:hypothetical protein
VNTFWGQHIPLRLGGLDFRGFMFLYNLPHWRCLPYKHRQLPGATRHKWIRPHRPRLLGLHGIGRNGEAAVLFPNRRPTGAAAAVSGASDAEQLLYSMPLLRFLPGAAGGALRDLPCSGIPSHCRLCLPGPCGCLDSGLYGGRRLAAPVVTPLLPPLPVHFWLAFVFGHPRLFQRPPLPAPARFPETAGIRAQLLGLAAWPEQPWALPPPNLPARARCYCHGAGRRRHYLEPPRSPRWLALLTDGVMLVQFVAVWLAVGR